MQNRNCQKIFLISSIFTYVLIALFVVSCKTTTYESNRHIEIITKDTTPKVIGIGGIFFKSKNPKEALSWYGKNLGLAIDDYGSPFEFRNANFPEEINYLRWSVFPNNTTAFAPSNKDFMINYRVQNIKALVDKLRGNGVVVVDSIETYDYGKFVHIMDADGNKIELWEPIDSILTKLGTKTTK